VKVSVAAMQSAVRFRTLLALGAIQGVIDKLSKPEG
jgi:hypothetical protein